ncbi:MAG: VWA domain-containing protein [Verrucomicrobia bacterium]|nr:VWA domain-containing protein [Verrucomicrobiota bacterium]
MEMMNMKNGFGFLSLMVVAAMSWLLTGCDPGQSGYTITVQPVPETTPGSTSAQQLADQNGLRESIVDPQAQPASWPPAIQGQGADLSTDPLAQNYYIVLDASGSMSYTIGEIGGEKRIDAAKKAVVAFLQQLPRDVHLGLLSFQPTRELVALGPNNHQSVAEHVLKLTPQGKTPLYKAITIGFSALEDQARKQSGYGTYKLIIVTDGESNDDNPVPLARSIVENSPVEIHVIGFAISEHALNIPGVTHYVSANSSEELRQALTDTTKSEVESFDSLDFDK